MEHLTIVINEDGTVVCIDSAASRIIAESLGVTTVSRASHVEPVNGLLRFIFHFVRERVADNSRVAEATRRIPCLWQITVADEFGGHTLPGQWWDRSEAIAHEVNWLNERFTR